MIARSDRWRCRRVQRGSVPAVHTPESPGKRGRPGSPGATTAAGPERPCSQVVRSRAPSSTSSKVSRPLLRSRHAPEARSSLRALTARRSACAPTMPTPRSRVSPAAADKRGTTPVAMKEPVGSPRGSGRAASRADRLGALGQRRAGPTGVTPELSADRRRAASKPPSDRPHRLTTGPGDRDLLAVIERQTPTLQIPPAARSYPSLHTQPASAFLTIGTRLSRRRGDELTTCHRRPEHLHNLRDHPVRELRHHASAHPPSKETSRAPGPDRTARRSPLRLRPPGSASRRPARYSTTERR